MDNSFLHECIQCGSTQKLKGMNQMTSYIVEFCKKCNTKTLFVHKYESEEFNRPQYPGWWWNLRNKKWFCGKCFEDEIDPNKELLYSEGGNVCSVEEINVSLFKKSRWFPAKPPF